MRRSKVVRFILRALLLSLFMYFYVIGIMSIDWDIIDLEGKTPLEVKMLLFIMNFSVAFVADKLLLGLFSAVEFVMSYYKARKKTWIS